VSNIRTYLGDCLEVMDKLILEGVVVDAIITDLPYGTTQNKWDCIIPFDEMWARINKIKKENAPVILFAQTPFDKVLGASNINSLKYEWIWEKSQPTGFLNAKKMPLKYHENILVFYDKLPTYNPILREKPLTNIRPKHSGKTFKNNGNYGDFKHGDFREIGIEESYPSNIIKFDNPQNGYHPTEKPIRLIEYLIRTYTNENDLVLDFTMGSGTTVVASKALNRGAIGIEKECGYFDIANKRLEQVQGALF